PPHTYTLSLHDALPISQFLPRPAQARHHGAQRGIDDPAHLFVAQPLDSHELQYGALLFRQTREPPQGAAQEHLVFRASDRSRMLDRKSTRLNSSHVAIS